MTAAPRALRVAVQGSLIAYGMALGYDEATATATAFQMTADDAEAPTSWTALAESFVAACRAEAPATSMMGLVGENTRLRWALREARDELAKWGWGDFHYGQQPQEKSVVDTIAKIDLVLGGEANPLRDGRTDDRG